MTRSLSAVLWAALSLPPALADPYDQAVLAAYDRSTFLGSTDLDLSNAEYVIAWDLPVRSCNQAERILNNGAGMVACLPAREICDWARSNPTDINIDICREFGGQ